MTRQASSEDIARLAEVLPAGVSKAIATRLPRHGLRLRRQDMDHGSATAAYLVGPLEVRFRLGLTGDRQAVTFDVEARPSGAVAHVVRSVTLTRGWHLVYASRLRPDAGAPELLAALAFAASKLKWGDPKTSVRLAA